MLLSASELPEHLPPEIGDFTELQTLKIHYPLKSLPPEIGKLKKLKSLYLINTQLKTLPTEFQNLRLKKLYVSHRNLCKSSQKILAQLKKNNENLEIFEVIPNIDGMLIYHALSLLGL